MPRPRRLLAVLALLLMVGLLPACSQLPTLRGRTVSSALQDASGTRMAAVLEPALREHPGRSGIVPLEAGREAFAARMHLAESADRTLDVQYYIWRADVSGMLLLDALRRAADRGVRVRLLLDDNNTQGLDATLAALDAHPGIEVRLFNPFPNRGWRLLGYLTDFSRLNRRMHNKSFTADNMATIIGGRNIGDAYFDVGGELLFADLDVLAIGPVVREVSADFDRYWASASAYPVERLLPPAEPSQLSDFAARASALAGSPAAMGYMEALRRMPFVQDLLVHKPTVDWAEVHMVSDDPAKGLGMAKGESLLLARLGRIMARPERRLALVSPYFVPGAQGLAAFSGMARRGVDVLVLTNSLAASDVPAVHAGYAKRRHALLAAGVKLYEMKHVQDEPAASGRVRLTGSSTSSLHAKTFVVDGERVFVGSFNFDPRSALLNTELGFVIESPSLARTISESLNRQLATSAWQVRLDAEGALQWVDQGVDPPAVFTTEPGTSLGLRLGVGLLSLLPIDWLL